MQKYREYVGNTSKTQSQKMRESTLKIHKLLIQEHTQRKINNACKKSQIAYIQAS
ncbi:MAG: hypothetical protein IJ218_03125 [Alphaproteobacteria bacterium]|nr:hypothetical protein [Alphaproteobacteria bacterium]